MSVNLVHTHKFSKFHFFFSFKSSGYLNLYAFDEWGLDG